MEKLDEGKKNQNINTNQKNRKTERENKRAIAQRNSEKLMFFLLLI